MSMFADLDMIESYIPPAGKCDAGNIVPVSLPIDELSLLLDKYVTVR